MADHTADCGAAFGEEVLMADPLKYEKMILDLPAARLLEEKGIDCGLADWSRTAIPSVEVFVQDRKSETPVLERILLSDVGKGAPFAKTGGFYQVQCKEGAQTESYFEAGASQYPSSYRYHNGTTEFLVFTFDGLAVGESSSIFASYCRQNQIMDFVGGEYPFIRGFSEVYSLCARSQDSKKTAVLFENLSMDPIFDFEIELGRACAGYTLTGAVGQLSEDRKRIMITSDFGPSSVILLEADYD